MHLRPLVLRSLHIHQTPKPHHTQIAQKDHTQTLHETAIYAYIRVVWGVQLIGIYGSPKHFVSGTRVLVRALPLTGYRNSGDMQSRVPVRSLYSPQSNREEIPPARGGRLDRALEAVNRSRFTSSCSWRVGNPKQTGLKTTSFGTPVDFNCISTVAPFWAGKL